MVEIYFYYSMGTLLGSAFNLFRGREIPNVIQSAIKSQVIGVAVCLFLWSLT